LGATGQRCGAKHSKSASAAAQGALAFGTAYHIRQLAGFLFRQTGERRGIS